MSDLQCPATVVLVAPGVLARVGAAAIAAGENLAGTFDVNVADGATLRQRVDELADLYRGETIVVVAPADAIRTALGAGGAVDQPVAVAVDSTGWRVLGSRPMRA